MLQPFGRPPGNTKSYDDEPATAADTRSVVSELRRLDELVGVAAKIAAEAEIARGKLLGTCAPAAESAKPAVIPNGHIDILSSLSGNLRDQLLRIDAAVRQISVGLGGD